MSNVVVQEVSGGIVKVDLLFMIDNSISMADKQTFFARAIPALVGRLVTPRCVDGSSVRDPLVDGGCPAGFAPELESVRDIHLAIVSSSLGDHTGGGCEKAEQNDAAHLVGSLPRSSGVPTQQGLGFLAWDPDQKQGGVADASELIDTFRDLVTRTGEQGCGFEASLEAWYRFLIEPFPAASLVRPDPGNTWTEYARDAQGNVLVDQIVLDQRRAFLRPDSLVSIIVLSDENDCSIRVPGSAAAVTGLRELPRASSACEEDANHACCRSCGQPPAPDCPDNGADPECSLGARQPESDVANLRCFEQKRRFGVDFLFPTARYAVGLSKPRLCPESPYGDADCDCDLARETLGIQSCDPGPEQPNPLFVDPETGIRRRSADLVYYAAIVGVPWQDLATPDTLEDPTRLRYMTAEELTQGERWDVVLGDPSSGRLPLDPFMHESVAPRSGTNPITGDAIEPPDAPFQANAINGHEYLATANLQHACIFSLPAELQRDCSTVVARGCDCDPVRDDPSGTRNPLCQDESGYGSMQRFAKAYPGLRQLDVAKRFGKNAIVASVCPKIIDDLPDFGYAPAVDAIANALIVHLRDACLPRPIDRRADDTLPCHVVEVTFEGAAGCGALQPGRSSTRDFEPELDRAVRAELFGAGRCSTPDCADACLATLNELSGAERTSCESDLTPPDAIGYCYVDPAPPPAGSGIGNPALVAQCPATQKRLLRLVGSDTPQRGSVVYMACAGRSFGSAAAGL